MSQVESRIYKVVENSLFENREDSSTFLKIAAKYLDKVEELDEVAYLQFQIKDYNEAVQTLNRCYSFCSTTAEQYSVLSNIVKLYSRLNEPEKAIIILEKLMEVAPDDVNLKTEYSFCNYLMNDYKKAEEILTELLKIPNINKKLKGMIEYNMGTYLMEKGEFRKGLENFVGVGHDIGVWKTEDLPLIPQWDGTFIKDQVLFIQGEAGFGDELINVRFLKEIQDAGMKPIWITPRKDLVDTLRRHGFDATSSLEFVDKDDALQCKAMYLPLLLNKEKNNLWTGAYLTADPVYVEKWKAKLPKDFICVKWEGNPEYDHDLHRKIPVEKILALPYENKVNLQLEDYNQPEGLINIAKEITCLDDTLAIMHLSNGVVTSCTSAAHMAGALGVRTIVCPPIARYYIWLDLNNQKSNWYSEKLKVIKQNKCKEWNDVFEQVNTEVNQWQVT